MDTLSMFTLVIDQMSFMQDTVRPFFVGIDEGGIATSVKNSLILIPIAGCLHLVALSLLGGAVILADLRVLGPGVTARTPVELNRSMSPFLIAAGVGLIVSGIFLALGQMMRLYASPPYWLKMASLLSAIVFTFAARDPVIREEGKFTPFAWVGLAVSMAIFWISWINLTDWFFGARQAYLVFILILLALVFAPKIVPAGIKAKIVGLPVFVSAPAMIVVLFILSAAIFWLTGIDYMGEIDMNGMGLGAWFQPKILGMMLLSFLFGLILYTGIGNSEHPLSMRLMSAISIFLWGSTAISGRWIAFW